METSRYQSRTCASELSCPRGKGAGSFTHHTLTPICHLLRAVANSSAFRAATRTGGADTGGQTQHLGKETQVLAVGSCASMCGNGKG